MKMVCLLACFCFLVFTATSQEPVELSFLQDSSGNELSVSVNRPTKQKNSSRKLAFIDTSNILDPFPPRPSPISPSSHAPSATSSPAFAARSPLPSSAGDISPTPDTLLPYAPASNPTSPPFLPSSPPIANPASPPFGPNWPPCEPSGVGGSAGAPQAATHHYGMWCVAKASVPSETLQKAMNYACGEDEADCEAIAPGGSCYFPDNVVAHASYAFNSYWQKTKENGGTCGFGGTAMLISSNPSYGHCRYIVI